MPGLFIPARSSRHRAACLALYRALLRQIPSISLPHDVAGGPGDPSPIAKNLRRAFKQNRHDTSPRLVISALKHGYKFLSVLKAAQHAPSPDHDSLVAFLREDAAAAAGRLAASDEPPSPWAPRPGTIPLLTKVEPRPGSTSTTAPRYEATLRPLPRAQLTGGVRKLPLLESGNGIPFLRLGKPQSPVLSRVVRQKGARLQKQIAKRKALTEEDLVAAREEDQWDGLMRDLGAREETAQKARFADPVVASIAEARAWLVADREDRVARAKAMWDIVVKERALSKKETEERKARRKERWETIKAARSIRETSLGTRE